MKISFEKKILLGFVINLLIVFISTIVFVFGSNSQKSQTSNTMLNWLEYSLFVLSSIILIVVYFIMRRQMAANNFSESQLSEKKKLFQDFIDASPNGIFIKKLNGEYILVNKKYKSLFQTADEEIIGKTDHDFLTQDLADATRNSDYEVAKAHKEIQTEETIDQPDGINTYIVVKFPLYDNTARIYAIGGILTEINERKKLENSLMASNKFFEMSLDMMIIASMDKFLKVNPATIKTLGYSKEELINSSFFTFMVPDDYEITQKEVEKLKTGALTIEFENRYICKDGSIKWISWSTSPDVPNGLLYAVARDVTGQKEIKKSLDIADQFFNLTFAMFMVIEKDNFIRINPVFTKILGYNPSEIIGQPYLPLIHPEDLEATVEAIKKMIEGEPVRDHRTRALAKSGSYKWFDWNGTYNAETGSVYALARDVSNLIESENSLEIVNNFFEIAFDPFFVTLDMKIIKINPAFTKILGYFQNDLEKISLLDIIHPDYKEIAKERLDNPVKEDIGLPNLIIIPILSKNGSYIWIEARISPDGGTGMTFTVLHDISQRKMNEEKINIANKKLIDDEQQIKSIFDNAPDPVIVIDSESKIIKWNPRAEFLFGWLEADVIGKPVYEFIIPKRYVELYKKGMANFLLTGVGSILSHTLEIEAVNKQGFEFPIALSISPFKMEEKDFFIGFVRDITETKKAIDDLQKNEEKLKLILENIGEGIIVANSDKKVIMVNDMVSELYENEGDEKITPNLASHFELYFPDGKTVFPSQNLPMERALKGEATDDVDLILLHPITKKKRRVLISGRPLLDENNKIVVAMVTIKDISKYKELEEELKKTELKYKQSIGFKKTDE